MRCVLWIRLSVECQAHVCAVFMVGVLAVFALTKMSPVLSFFFVLQRWTFPFLYVRGCAHKDGWAITARLWYNSSSLFRISHFCAGNLPLTHDIGQGVFCFMYISSMGDIFRLRSFLHTRCHRVSYVLFFWVTLRKRVL